jgi:hypothetical protein
MTSGLSSGNVMRNISPLWAIFDCYPSCGGRGAQEMERYEISSDSASSDLIPLALAVHAVLGGLPVTIRSQNHRGVQIEDGKVKSRDYTGPILEQVLADNITIRTQPKAGEYKSVPVIVTPIQNSKGSAIAAIGVVDVTGIFDLADLMSQQSQIISQLRYCPVPLKAAHRSYKEAIKAQKTA